MPRRSGKYVELPDGRRGFTYNDEKPINDKLRVYLVGSDFQPTGDKVLKAPADLKLIGYID